MVTDQQLREAGFTNTQAKVLGLQDGQIMTPEIQTVLVQANAAATSKKSKKKKSKKKKAKLKASVVAVKQEEKDYSIIAEEVLKTTIPTGAIQNIATVGGITMSAEIITTLTALLPSGLLAQGLALAAAGLAVDTILEQLGVNKGEGLTTLEDDLLGVIGIGGGWEKKTFTKYIRGQPVQYEGYKKKYKSMTANEHKAYWQGYRVARTRWSKIKSRSSKGSYRRGMQKGQDKERQNAHYYGGHRP